MSDPVDLSPEYLHRAFIDGRLYMLESLLRALVREHPNLQKLEAIGRVMLGSDQLAAPDGVRVDEWMAYRDGTLQAFDAVFDGAED
jgi:hypothetical protein